jgi:hypothetical protein
MLLYSTKKQERASKKLRGVVLSLGASGESAVFNSDLNFQAYQVTELNRLSRCNSGRLLAMSPFLNETTYDMHAFPKEALQLPHKSANIGA